MHYRINHDQKITAAGDLIFN